MTLFSTRLVAFMAFDAMKRSRGTSYNRETGKEDEPSEGKDCDQYVP